MPEAIESFFAQPLKYFGQWPITSHSRSRRPDNKDKQWPWGEGLPMFDGSAEVVWKDNQITFMSLPRAIRCPRLRNETTQHQYEVWREMCDAIIAVEIQAARREFEDVHAPAESPEERERREWVPTQMAYVAMERLKRLVEPDSMPAAIVGKYNSAREALIALDMWIERRPGGREGQVQAKI